MLRYDTNFCVGRAWGESPNLTFLPYSFGVGLGSGWVVKERMNPALCGVHPCFYSRSFCLM